MEGAFDRINEEVASWPGVEAGTGKRGEWSFKLGPREVGHLHGDRAAHFMFAEGRRDRAQGRGPGRRPPGVPGQARARPRGGSSPRTTSPR